MLQEQSSESLKISSLTLDQKKELVEKYNHSDYLKVGTFVDAHDSTHQYLFAQVVEVDSSGLAHVCFDGWSKKWNSWLKIKSIKIRPFRTEAEGYSGQKRVAIRNDMDNYDQEVLIKVSGFHFDKIFSITKKYNN